MVDYNEMWEYQLEHGDPSGMVGWMKEFIGVLLKEITRLNEDNEIWKRRWDEIIGTVSAHIEGEENENHLIRMVSDIKKEYPLRGD